MRGNLSRIAFALCAVSLATLNACTIRSVLAPGVTASDIPQDAPIVFTGTTVQIVGIHGPVEDTTRRGPEVKAIIDRRIRERLTGGGLHLACAPPADGRYTVLSVNAEYKPWDPLAGGGMSLDGRLTDDHGQVLMTPTYSANISFAFQDGTVNAVASNVAVIMVLNLQMKYKPLSEAEEALIDSCAPRQAAQPVS